MLGAVAADLHAVLHHAAELREIHVELPRHHARIDAHVLVVELAHDRVAYTRRQFLLQHALDEGDVGVVEAGGHGVGGVQDGGGGAAGVAVRLDPLAHALRQRGRIAAGAGQDEMDLMRR